MRQCETADRTQLTAFSQFIRIKAKIYDRAVDLIQGPLN